MSREVMQMALDALENSHANEPIWKTPIKQAIEALRTALAQPEKECSRVECGGNNGCIDICWKKKPQRKELVGLTDENIFAVLENLQEMYNRPPTTDSRVIFARAIEAKLKEKNT